MAEAFHAAGEARYSEALGLDDAGFAAYVTSLRRRAEGEGLPRGRVAERTFWLTEGDRVLGVSRLRPRLLPFHERLAGHVGFDLAPDARDGGAGARLLALTLEKAREAGLSRVLICVDPENEPRRRSVEAAGASFLDEVSGVLPEGDAYRKHRYVLQP